MTGTRDDPIVSPHARKRIKQMGLTDHRVAAVLSEPDIEYRGSTRYGRGRRVAVRDTLAVVFTARGGRVRVITVLWHRAEGRDVGDE